MPQEEAKQSSQGRGVNRRKVLGFIRGNCRCVAGCGRKRTIRLSGKDEYVDSGREKPDH